VVGGGGFGQALAKALLRAGRRAQLWSRRDLDLDGVETTQDLADLKRSELLFLAVPSSYVPETARELGKHLDGEHLVVHVSRGLVGDDLLTLSRVLRRTTPAHRTGVLAGPLDAEALAEGEPAGAIVGSRFPEVARAVREAIGGDTLRIYESRDVVGVEVAAAVVGYLALAVGVGQELGVSPATVAVSLTRGMAEAARWAPSLQADPETLYGLAGLGDLLAVTGGDDRPEVRLGRALATGASLEEAGRAAGAHIEGVTIARRVDAHARKIGESTPIAGMIADVVEGRRAARDAMAALMAREVGTE
jgi:glycerol-3-phosphate dehydrogenase (NAD(P)+)